MTSFCGQFNTFSKVVLCLMMVRGRHRSLPYALDRAIMLPNDIQSHLNDSSDAQSSDDATESKVVLPTTSDSNDIDEPAGMMDIRQQESTFEKNLKDK